MLQNTTVGIGSFSKSQAKTVQDEIKGKLAVSRIRENKNRHHEIRSMVNTQT